MSECSTDGTHFEYADRIARSRRYLVKLHVSDQAHTHQLARFGTYAKVLLGNGITVIVIDFGSRVGNVSNEYKAG